MKITNIALDPETEDPTHLTAVLTVQEALLIATWLGKTNHTVRNELLPDGGVIGSEIYDCLAGGFFNRFWEDGINDARQGQAATA